MTTSYRSLTLRGAQDGALRTAMFNEREHVVVPVVALMEGVVHAVNSSHPEFVPASELAKTASGWNGEPVMFDHPSADGQKISANAPHVLEQWQLGQVFNTRMKGTRLLMDAYVDPSRVDKVGEQARKLLDTLAAGGVVEVSVGAFITAEQTPGTHNGRSYKAIWRDIVPDHLALLPEGVEGACSAKTGCGAGVPRAAAVHLVTAEGFEYDEEEGETPMANAVAPEGRPLRERVREFFKSLQASSLPTAAAEGAVVGTSDADLRRALDAMLRSTEPAYQGIDAVYPEEGVVIYAVNPTGPTQIFKRMYSLTDGEISLDGERVEVEPVLRYEPVAAEAAPSCGCHQQVNQSAESASAGVPTVHKNAERITSLIANPKTSWTEQDRAHLEAQPDERISALEAAAQAEPVAPPKKELTLDDLPAAWRQAIETQAAADAAARTESIDALAAAQSAFTRAELEAMPTAQLTKIAALAGVVKRAAPQPVTFAGRAPVAAARTREEVPPAPDFNAAIRAAAAARR